MWHVDCMFKMGCQFEMDRATTEGTWAECAATACQQKGKQYMIWPHLFPPQRGRIGGCPELSPNFPGAAFMRYVWTIEISPHKVTPTQLLHCHTELFQAVDLIPWKAFMCHWAEEETDRGNLQAQVQEQAEPCHVFRRKPALFVIPLVPWHSPALCTCTATR